ncbi:hypothetical protein [Corallococcus aberystwythensis]|uniref:Glycosyltransferase RgtA/B/C/D-like domain-containing protein n=1 Tax=Corallococcus aberystwythensis TaxID=2316722 RepID=A0A3A8R3N4_9BACT|nr:hypothetical protein [Corallococcus aberystwythensis]RKH74661.1 hypothetical protein D7W81_00465 [Corallococcus aberystwythensis]
MRAIPSRPFAVLTEAVCLLALVLACVKLSQGVEAVLDLALWDEADYLHRALTLPESGLPDPEWGPLYSLWYFALSRVWPDPVVLYYANTRWLVLLTSVACYALLRQAGARPGFALAASAVYLLSLAPHIQPRPTLLALLIILVASCAACRAATPEGAWARLGFGLLIASFARPECFLSFLGVSALLGLQLVRRIQREPARRRHAAATAAAYVGTTLVLMGLLGNPFSDTSNRRFYAFCQHFADGHDRRTGQVEVNPWARCEEVLQPVFGSASTLGAAVRANPGAFLAHVRWNVDRLPGEFHKVFTYGYGDVPLQPRNGAWTRTQVAHVLLLLVTLALPLVALVRRGRKAARALAAPRVAWRAVAAAGVMLPGLLSSVLYQPRHHYLVIPGVMGLALLAVLMHALEVPGTPPDEVAPLAGALLAALVVLAVPRLAFAQDGRGAPPKVLLQQVQALRGLGLDKHVAQGGSLGVLDTQGGLPVYLGVPFRRVPPWTRRQGESFPQYLRRERIELVFMDARLREEPRFQNDPSLESFLAAPGAFGYATRRLPGTDAVLALPAAWAH